MKRVQSIVAIATLLGAAPGAWSQAPGPGPAQSARPRNWIPHEITGVVKSIDSKGMRITIQTRDGREIQIDTAVAIEAHRANISAVGSAVRVHGVFDADGVLKASVIQREKNAVEQWVADR
jgi:hypothetical protein